ncbi:MAG: hypothetical protein L7V88_06290 [Alphaproteobacteria bacterium]|nr:hypothetical protein [Alphaproteobacteria bacterium]
MSISSKLQFLSIKQVPKLIWRSPKALTFQPPAISLLVLAFGLVLFGLGEALLLAAGAGVSPWTTLAEGISILTGWTIGFATFIISIAVLLTWVPLRQVPGLGTIANAFIVALMLDISLPYLPKPDLYIFQILQSLIGVLIVGFGAAIYLSANLGPGPRDGLMTGLTRLTNLPISLVRSTIEILVVVSGWMLGGTVGVGTVLFAFLVGPSISAGCFILRHLVPPQKSQK